MTKSISRLQEQFEIFMWHNYCKKAVGLEGSPERTTLQNTSKPH